MMEIIWTIPVTVIATVIGFLISHFIASGWEARRRYLHLKAMVKFRNDLRDSLINLPSDGIHVSGRLSYEEIKRVYDEEKAQVPSGEEERQSFVNGLKDSGMSEEDIDGILKRGYYRKALKDVGSVPWWEHWLPRD